MPTILITGAAGGIGTMLRSRLARPGRVLRLLDVVPLPTAAGPGEEALTASVTDMAAMTAACAGVDAVIHLGGIPSEDAWAPILDVNINGTYTVFEAARRAGVPRVVFASSNHAVGFAPAASFPVPDGAAPVPDTYYGVSKAAGEALAALYAHRYGLEAVCVRILSCFERPRNPRMLATWLSPDDAGRLFDACVTAPAPGFRVIYGVSANTRGGWVSLDGARALGYEPLDDAERYAPEVLAAAGTGPDAAWPDPDDPVFRYLGGDFTLPSRDAPIPPASSPERPLPVMTAVPGAGRFAGWSLSACRACSRSPYSFGLARPNPVTVPSACPAPADEPASGDDAASQFHVSAVRRVSRSAIMTGSTVRTGVNTPLLDTLRLTFAHHVRRVVTQRNRPRRSNPVRIPRRQGKIFP